MNEGTSPAWARLSGLRIGAVVAVAVAVAFLVWLLVRGDDDKASTTNTVSSTTNGGPVAADAERLRALSDQLGHPIYWAGPKPDTTYELTRTSSGRVFIRYLPSGVPVGVRKAAYTIVGTYTVLDAYKVLQDLAKKPGEQALSVPAGGFAVYDRSHPSNVYLAYPGSNLQIEVFDPSPQQVRRLVTSGLVTPVR